jgi:hypothetical protein
MLLRLFCLDRCLFWLVFRFLNRPCRKTNSYDMAYLLAKVAGCLEDDGKKAFAA